MYTPAGEGSPRLGAYSLQGTGVLYKSAPQGNPEELFTSDVDSRIPETRGRRTGPLVPIEEIAVDRLSLTLGDLLQEGTFGRIYQVLIPGPLGILFRSGPLVGYIRYSSLGPWGYFSGLDLWQDISGSPWL